MIELTKMNNTDIILNSDLIETVEQRPDTTITLVNGKILIIKDSVEDVVTKVIAYKQKLNQTDVNI